MVTRAQTKKMVENKMPKLMSMKDFLASGGAAVKAYKNKGVVPSYVAKPKTGTRVGATRNMKQQPMQMKKKRMMPTKKTGKGMPKK